MKDKSKVEMSKKTLYTILITISVLFGSCEFSISTNGVSTTDLGEMPEVRAEKLENLYVINENTCAERSLPITRCAIEYPSGYDVDFPHDEINHFIIKKSASGMVMEEFSIGNSTINLTNKTQTLALLENLVESFTDQFPDMEVITVGKKMFGGEMHYIFEGRVDYSAYKDQGYDGFYKLMMMIPLPKSNENLNAIILSMVASEQSEIQSFADFATKGLNGKIYQTFRYIE